MEGNTSHLRMLPRLSLFETTHRQSADVASHTGLKCTPKIDTFGRSLRCKIGIWDCVELWSLWEQRTTAAQGPEWAKDDACSSCFKWSHPIYIIRLISAFTNLALSDVSEPTKRSSTDVEIVVRSKEWTSSRGSKQQKQKQHRIFCLNCQQSCRLSWYRSACKEGPESLLWVLQEQLKINLMSKCRRSSATVCSSWQPYLSWM